MARKTHTQPKSQTLPSSPTHSFSSSSSSDFEFTISASPRKSSPNLCPADELFYKGQLLPLHLSPRLSMVRTIILSSSSTSSSSDSTTVASRDSTGSSTDSTASFNSDLALIGDCDSSRPSSAAADDNYATIKKPKYFSLSRFSSVFRRDPKPTKPDPVGNRVSVTAKEVIRKYLRKVKPLYEKLSQKPQQKIETPATAPSPAPATNFSFSGNLRLYPKRRRSPCVASCPSSMRSSPSHSGILYGNVDFISSSSSSCSSMEELQSAIQGAIAHCKNSMNQSKITSVEI